MESRAIRETSWNRTNADTVIAAYDKLTGASLRKIIEQTVAIPAKPAAAN